MTHLPFPTRRHFLKLSGISLAAAPLLAGAPLFEENTASLPSATPPLRIREVIDLIIAKIPGGKLENTVDTVKSGNPEYCTGFWIKWAGSPISIRSSEMYV